MKGYYNKVANATYLASIRGRCNASVRKSRGGSTWSHADAIKMNDFESDTSNMHDDEEELKNLDDSSANEDNRLLKSDTGSLFSFSWQGNKVYKLNLENVLGHSMQIDTVMAF